MEYNTQHIELINQYLNGLLSKKDIVSFKNKLQTDAVFQSTYNEHVVFLEGMKRKNLKAEIQAAQKSYMLIKWLKFAGLCGSVILISVLLYSFFFIAKTDKKPNTNNNIEIVNDSILVKKPTKENVEINKRVVDTFSSSIVEADKTNLILEVSQEENDVLEVETQKHDIDEAVKPIPLTNALIAFYKSVKKAPELLEINTEKEVTITCKEGTKLTIPKNAFVDTKTEKLIRGKVHLEVTEYYKLSDILLANLSTTSNNEILETGGMLLIEANKKGSNLRLKKDKQIQITFPNKGKKNMQLFSGDTIANTMNWKLQKDNAIRFMENTLIEEIIEEDVDVPLSIVEEVPVLSGCEKGSQVDKRNCLKDYLNTLMEKNFDTSIAKDLKLKGNHTVKVAFKINKEGNVSDIEAFASHTQLAQEAIRVLELIPKMEPAKQRGKAVAIPYSLPIYFNIGKSNKNNPSLIKLKSRTTFNATLLGTQDSVQSSKVSLKNANVSLNEVVNYTFSTSQLGWINCDRFVKTKNKIKFKIKVKEGEGANIKMVFQSLNSILPSKAIHHDFDFGMIPANEKVTLVAIKEIDDQFYLALKDIETISKPKVNLEFKPVTINALKTELRKLNQSFR